MAYGVVVGGSLIRRATASQQAQSLGSYVDGEYIYIENYDSQWYRTRFTYNGTTTNGYVMKAYVVTASDGVEVRKNDVNVRSGPGQNYGEIYRVNSGVAAPVLEIANDAQGTGRGWIKFAPSGYSTGWIRGDMLKKTSSGSGGGDPGTPTLGASFWATIRAGGTMLYTGPATSYPTSGGIGSAGGGATFYLFSGTNVDGAGQSWLVYIRSDNTYLYVQARDITGSESSSIGYKGQVYNTTNGVNMREKPSTSGTFIETLPDGTTLRIVDQFGDWYRVLTPYGMGWCHSDYIKYIP